MPLVKNTITGNNYLVKINTDGDACQRTAIRSYNKQSGRQGFNVNTRFYLPFSYDPGSHTLWVFVNGLKVVAEQTSTNNQQYEEFDNKTVIFGSPLNDDDVLEFIVAGSYLNDEEVGGGGGGGLTWILVDNDGDVLNDFGYMADTRTNPLTFTLPPSPVEGDTFAVADAFGTFGTTNATLVGNGLKILGSTSNYIFDTDGESLHLVFDGLDNWISIDNYGHNHDHNTLINYESDRHRDITVSLNSPTGGSNGDVWIKTF
jgi:hypothetical protein